MSWVVMNADDGRVIIETFDQKFAQSLKPRVEYVVAPAMVYLVSFNKAVRENGGTQPSDIQTLNIVKNALSISMEK